MNNNSNFYRLQVQLPTEVLCKIFRYLCYDNISKVRQVCKQFNDVGGSCLTQGFSEVQKKHAQCLKKVKDELPRRESERRKHRLYPKHDALQGLDTRLSLLKMTYTKFIQSGMCCFIPGKVLDEILLVLYKIRNSSVLPSITNLLQEVRDISSMAMEHFDDRIAPFLFGDLTMNDSSFYFDFNASSVRNIQDYSLPTTMPLPSLPEASNSDQKVLKLKKKQRNLDKKMKSMNQVVFQQRNELISMKRTNSKRSKLIKQLKYKVKRQRKCLNEVHAHLSELTTQIQALQSVLSLSDLSTSLNNNISMMLNSELDQPMTNGISSSDISSKTTRELESDVPASTTALGDSNLPHEHHAMLNSVKRKYNESNTDRVSAVKRPRT